MQETPVLKEVIKLVSAPEFVPVDSWVPDKGDMVFEHAKGVIIVPEIAQMYGVGDNSPISWFVMSKKKCYNSNTINKNDGSVSIGFRDHCTKYLSYFEKFYDREHELVSIYAHIKYCIDYDESYTEESFCTDLFRYIINHESAITLHNKVDKFVKDNFYKHLTYKNTKNPCLEYSDFHAKILMKISFIQNIVIPLIMQYTFIKNYDIISIDSLLMKIFDWIISDAKFMYNVDIYAKLFETVYTNVNKNMSNNKMLWDMQEIRARNNTTHSMDTIVNIITKIIPKYEFNKDIICFNFGVIQLNIKYNVTAVPYEYSLTSVSSSVRDEDMNSEADKFEAHISKIDESMILQTNATCSATMEKIKQIFGPFNDDEISFYMTELSSDGKSIKNQFQSNLISYLFLKYFKDMKAIKFINYREYIILMLAAKKYLSGEGQSLLPYIIGGKVDRLISRKTVNKKIAQRMEISENYPKVIAKYQNDKIQQEFVFKIISQILASEFRNIDYYHKELNGIKIECDPGKVCEEVLQYILLI